MKVKTKTVSAGYVNTVHVNTYSPSQAGLMPAPAEPMALVPSGDPSLKAPASSTGSASLTAATSSPVDDQPFLFFG